MPFAAILPAMIGGSLVSGAMGSSAAGKAANAQSQASMYAADKEKEAADQSLAFQKQVYADQLKNMAPWLGAGTGAIKQLSSGLNPGGTFSTVPAFTAPTAVTMQNDPGYQERIKRGLQAMESSAAAKGNIFSGSTMKALGDYAQDYASNEYNNVYNRALTQYNTDRSAQDTLFNRLAAVAGVGQTAAQNTNQAGSQAANNATGTLMTSAGNIGNQINNAAAARASGYVGGANAWSGAINNIAQLPLMYSLMR